MINKADKASWTRKLETLDTSMLKMLKKAGNYLETEEVGKIPKLPKDGVPFYGLTAVGKSTTINSLIGIDDVMAAAGGGMRETSCFWFIKADSVKGTQDVRHQWTANLKSLEDWQKELPASDYALEFDVQGKLMSVTGKGGNLTEDIAECLNQLLTDQDGKKQRAGTGPEEGTSELVPFHNSPSEARKAIKKYVELAGGFLAVKEVEYKMVCDVTCHPALTHMVNENIKYIDLPGFEENEYINHTVERFWESSDVRVAVFLCDTQRAQGVASFLALVMRLLKERKNLRILLVYRNYKPDEPTRWRSCHVKEMLNDLEKSGFAVTNWLEEQDSRLEEMKERPDEEATQLYDDVLTKWKAWKLEQPRQLMKNRWKREAATAGADDLTPREGSSDPDPEFLGRLEVSFFNKYDPRSVKELREKIVEKSQKAFHEAVADYLEKSVSLLSRLALSCGQKLDIMEYMDVPGGLKDPVNSLQATIIDDISRACHSKIDSFRPLLPGGPNMSQSGKMKDIMQKLVIHYLDEEKEKKALLSYCIRSFLP